MLTYPGESPLILELVCVVAKEFSPMDLLEKLPEVTTSRRAPSIGKRPVQAVKDLIVKRTTGTSGMLISGRRNAGFLTRPAAAFTPATAGGASVLANARRVMVVGTSREAYQIQGS